jgi:hypothetical protein
VVDRIARWSMERRVNTALPDHLRLTHLSPAPEGR